MAWPNLIAAHRQAVKGKRGSRSAAQFEFKRADYLLGLQHELSEGVYAPGNYHHFYIHEPKRRRISAAPFRDRVVHHALCNVLEPVWEQRFIPTSFANRRGKGTHRAIGYAASQAARFRYVLRLDVVKHFAAIDHQVLIDILEPLLPDTRMRALVGRIIRSGEGILDQEAPKVLFQGDDLFSQFRPKGLPIGNLTSQFWSNCYLHCVDKFAIDTLPCGAYARYVDDFVLFANRKSDLWACKRALVERLARLRLTLHETSAMVSQTRHGFPWLGTVVYPSFCRLKRRKIISSRRQLRHRYRAWREGTLSFAQLDASVQGWLAHAAQVDSWETRRKVLAWMVS